jgi:hypothetical protein
MISSGFCTTVQNPNPPWQSGILLPPPGPVLDHNAYCRFLTESSCGIHDCPRPSVCTDYVCVYVNYGLPEAYWPRACKVVATTCDLADYAGSLEMLAAMAEQGLSPDDRVVQLTETATRALLALDARKFAYHLFRRAGWWRWWAVHPHGVQPWEATG